MTDPIKRVETTHIDEVCRRSTSTSQWLLERENISGAHPITHNSEITFHICGKDAFADIAARIAQAKESIDICCWGFDPGMELVRDRSKKFWPRGETYGDLLIAAGNRGVKVRLLVWYDALAVRTKNPRNMPGYTHDIDSQHRKRPPAERTVSAEQSVTISLLDKSLPRDASQEIKSVGARARRYYCMDWYDAALGVGLPRLKNIEVRAHSGNADAIAKSLAGETSQPSDGDMYGAERLGMVHLGTHHQKPILIDFFHNEGEKAVGYVMGLNSLTEYWDTADHLLDDSRREREDAIGSDLTPGCEHIKPLRDYACRIDGGCALLPIYHNFIKAWERAAPSGSSRASPAEGKRPSMPAGCLRKARPGDSTVQIVRTQPAEGDKTIRDIYFQVTDQATLAMGYLYLENQYFQYTDWAKRLMEKRKEVMKGWCDKCACSGKNPRDMPTLHVFIVIPAPEKTFMIPRTYDTLATMGQQQGMKGQCDLIKKENERPPEIVYSSFGTKVSAPRSLPPVIEDANQIAPPTEAMLETTYGMKVCTAMLNTCDLSKGKWRFREIYIHSKLLMVDDTFVTLGSANLNQRSMAVDSEINLAALAPEKVRELRREIWTQIGGGDCSGGNGSRAEIALAFQRWKALMSKNAKNKRNSYAITNQLLPLRDGRSSLIRLG